jgi:S1-C subfamily serine protease
MPELRNRHSHTGASPREKRAARPYLGAENIGFAIAIDHALPVIEQILSDAPEQRAWLGVVLAPVDSTAAATSLGLDPSVRGVLIQELVQGAPAEDAGLRPGDVIVAIEGDGVRSLEDLTRVLTRYEPGETIEVSVVAADDERTVPVTLEQRPVAEAQD